MSYSNRGIEILLSTASLVGVGLLATASFSPGSRRQIWERANNKSELSGDFSRPLVCSHLNHDKSDQENYNNPKNGVLSTDIEELARHLMFIKRAEEIGLNNHRNNIAINLWIEDIIKYNRENGGPINPEIILNQCRNIIRIYLDGAEIEMTNWEILDYIGYGEP